MEARWSYELEKIAVGAFTDGARGGDNVPRRGKHRTLGRFLMEEYLVMLNFGDFYCTEYVRAEDRESAMVEAESYHDEGLIPDENYHFKHTSTTPSRELISSSKHPTPFVLLPTE